MFNVVGFIGVQTEGEGSENYVVVKTDKLKHWLRYTFNQAESTPIECVTEQDTDELTSHSSIQFAIYRKESSLNSRSVAFGIS